MEITLKEVDVHKINLQPNDVLVAKLTGDYTQEVAENLREALKYVFEENKVFVMLLPHGDDVKFEVVNEVPIGCGVPELCIDCACGKKERNSNDQS